MLPEDVPNPFKVLAGEAGKIIADSWTVAMVGLWNAGLWVFRVVLRFVDALTTPDLSESGPGAVVYQATFWLAGALVLILVMIQLGVAALRRDPKSLATVLLGLGKFVVVWAGWVGYGVAVVAACGGLTRALMASLLKVHSWSAWQPWASFTVADGVDGTVATVLGLMGLLLWLAAVGHLLVMLTRGGALMVLVATAPISAAGLVGDTGRSWFWKSLRWFHAAAFTPVLMVVVLGVGVQMTTGVANGLADHTQAAIGTALPGVVMILIGCFAPLGLFKLLAFVEPGTSSGAALRQGLAAHGGLQGLLAGPGGNPGPSTASGPSTATHTDRQGRSQGESAGEDSTAARFTQAQTGMMRQVGGEVGGAADQGLRLMQKVGATGAAVSADLTNQMGVGHTSYHPDFSGLAGRGSGPARAHRGPTGNHHPAGGAGSGNPPDTSPPIEPVPSSPNPSAAPPERSVASAPSPGPSQPYSSAPPPRSSGSAPDSPATGASSGGAGGAQVAEAAATVPIVPA